MKQMLSVVTAILTLSVVAGMPQAFGQHSPASEVSPVPMRIRLVNLNYVIKHYKKYDRMKALFIDLAKKHEAELKDLKQQLDEQKALLEQSPATSAQHEKIDTEVVRLQREFTAKREDARKALAKREKEMVSIIYGEVEKAVRQYALSAKLDLVLHYNDVTDEAERMDPANIARKMSAGACMPMYMAPGIDISQEIVNILNENLKSKPTSQKK